MPRLADSGQQKHNLLTFPASPHKQCHVVTVTFLNGHNEGPITVFCDRWEMFLKRFVVGLNFHNVMCIT